MHEHDFDDETAAVCRVGNHRHTGTGALCARHLTENQELLAGIARMARRLTYCLAPGGGGTPGDKVTTTRVGSPTPARLDVLNLLAGGGREIRRDARLLAPQVRRWSTATPYHVETIVRTDHGPTTVVEQRTVRTWHSEVVTNGIARRSVCSCGVLHDRTDRDRPTGTSTGQPVLVMEDDQVGSIPPAEWADEWVRHWRLALGHTSSPIRGRVDLACDADQRKRLERARIAESVRTARGIPAMLPAVSAYLAIATAYEQHRREVQQTVALSLLGISSTGPAHQARVAQALAGARHTTVAHDSVSAEWTVRHGFAQTAAAVEVDTTRLADWLELAADADESDERVELSRFVSELRSLHSELAHVVGDSRDEQRLGRCPALLRDRDGEETDRLCGTVLRQDPYLSIIECARCHSRWPERDWLGLAALIRTRWPIDAQRRYTMADRAAAEANVENLPRCPGCDRPMRIEWRDDTTRGDKTPMWTPARTVCPAGCLSGGTTAAAA